ncbi:uclacyanin 1-like protein [Tanacetum coccineum]
MARVSIMKMLMVFAATAMLVDMAMAVDYTVGSPNEGWDLSTDLPTWASSQTFSVGDNLDFQFTSTHDVLEVTRENYDSCGLGSPISTTVTSPARFLLTAAGSLYFIRGRGAHCSQGMKVQIDVGLTPSPPPPLITPPPAPTPQTTPPPSATPPSPMPPPQSTPPSPTPTPTPTQTTPPSPTPTPPQTTPPSSATPPENDPSGSSPPPPITGETADPPSSAVTLKMTAGSILGFGLFVMMLLSL